MKAHLHKVVRKLSPAHITSHYSTKRVIQHFAESMGLVYFGQAATVDDDEEEQVVRGVTVSVSHHDAHYCVGTYEGYDVSFVERTDHLKPNPGAPSKPHTWHIIEIDLHTKRDLPHVFVGQHTHTEAFYRQLFIKFPALRPVRLGALAAYDNHFLSTYRIYTRPTNTLEVERVLTPQVTGMISKHFGNLAIEIAHETLYIYSEHNHVGHALLEAMLKNGVWLARQIDEANKKEG